MNELTAKIPTEADLDAISLVQANVSEQSLIADSCECNDCEDSPQD